MIPITEKGYRKRVGSMEANFHTRRSGQVVSIVPNVSDVKNSTGRELRLSPLCIFVDA
jgi:hypothetical protein